jgi:pyrimidine operon attenuation protein/uracil phosphoribosyltransferase
MKTILNNEQISLTIKRLAHQLLETHQDFSNSVIVGLQPRGVFLSDAIVKVLKEILPNNSINYGKLDITFYRDDFRQKGKPLLAKETDIEFSLENKKVILIDDVLYSGRTIRAALDAILDFGRPSEVELLVLVDRRMHRNLPIEANYIGREVDSIVTERVVVEWKETDGEDKIWIINE